MKVLLLLLPGDSSPIVFVAVRNLLFAATGDPSQF